MKKYTFFVLMLIILFANSIWQNQSNNWAKASSGQIYAGRFNGNYLTYLPIITKPSVPLQTQPVWRALLLVYHNTDADYIDENGIQQHLTTSMPESEMQTAMWSFRQATSIANDFSESNVIIKYDIVHITRPINSLTLIGQPPLLPRGDSIQFVDGRPVLTPIDPNVAPNSHSYWVSPNDSRIELDTYAPSGKYDSIFIHWMQCDMITDQCIPSFGWGWGMQASSWSNGATYATVANADDWVWHMPIVGEVWLHEWLHGVCPFYEGLGYPQPEGDADGGSAHGYEWSPTTGWSLYYRDLMIGQVWEPLLGTYTGITSQAWNSRSILSYGDKVFADYYYVDTSSTYQQTGVVNWNASEENMRLGSAVPDNNKLYKGVIFNTTVIVSGRAYIPDTDVGAFDTVAIGLWGGGVEYWATLAYGTNLAERNNISIMRNDVWGNLYPMILNPGWYTVEVLVDYTSNSLRMKAWPDGANEPEWQVSRPLDINWIGQGLGFRHYGQGTYVDDLMVIEAQVSEGD